MFRIILGALLGFATILAVSVNGNLRKRQIYNPYPSYSGYNGNGYNYGYNGYSNDVYNGNNEYNKGCNEYEEGPINAVAIINKDGKIGSPGISGVLTFYQRTPGGLVRINGTLYNVAPVGKHGMHVHRSGDMRNGCTSAGPHYNPIQKTHGDIKGSPRHLGDLGNIESINGVATINILVDSYTITLFGCRSIIGRALVVHQNIDDLGKKGDEESKKTGNSGPRIGCGPIVFVEPN